MGYETLVRRDAYPKVKELSKLPEISQCLIEIKSAKICEMLQQHCNLLAWIAKEILKADRASHYDQIVKDEAEYVHFYSSSNSFLLTGDAQTIDRI